MSIFWKILGVFGRLGVRRRRFAADERGTTAIEFGLLGVPFFGLLAAILETSYVFLGGQILDTAVQDASRYIRTGQVQSLYKDNQTLQFSTFQQKVCDGLYKLFDCSKLWFSVETVGGFTNISRSSPVPTTCSPTSCDWTSNSIYQVTKASDVVLIRVYYKWPTIINLGGFTLANTGGNSRLLGAVRVFANEPF